MGIEGNYIRTEEKDYDKFLSTLGVGFLLRKAATASTPSMTISKSGDKWSMVTATSLKKSLINTGLSEGTKPLQEIPPQIISPTEYFSSLDSRVSPAADLEIAQTTSLLVFLVGFTLILALKSVLTR